MKRAYKYRFYPTPDQVELLAQTFGCVRFVYNSILRWRTDAYYDRQEKIGYTQASSRLTALKKELEFSWLNDVSSVPLQQALRHQQAAFSNFFAGRAKYPTFKSKHHKQAATLTDAAFKYRDGELYGKEQSTFRCALESPFAVHALYCHRVRRFSRAILRFVPLRV